MVIYPHMNQLIMFFQLTIPNDENVLCERGLLYFPTSVVSGDYKGLRLNTIWGSPRRLVGRQDNMETPAGNIQCASVCSANIGISGRQV